MLHDATIRVPDQNLRLHRDAGARGLGGDLIQTPACIIQTRRFERRRVRRQLLAIVRGRGEHMNEIDAPALALREGDRPGEGACGFG